MDHYDNEEYINTLVDEYKKNETDELKMKILQEFDPYFKKYSRLFCSSYPVDLNNKDTIKFLRLFMSQEDRTDDLTINSAAKRVINFLRNTFKDYTMTDIYDEVVCAFLKHLDRYKPMIADHKKSRERISFTHFIQVNIRFELRSLVRSREKDALYCNQSVMYDDSLFAVDAYNPDMDHANVDIRWVHGDNNGVFSKLTEMERYLIFLKYEDCDDKPLSEYALSRITGMDRMYIRRKMAAVKLKLQSILDS